MNTEISPFTSSEKTIPTQPEGITDDEGPETSIQLETVEEKSLDGAEIETITVNSEVNNNEDLGLMVQNELKDEADEADEAVTSVESAPEVQETKQPPEEDKETTNQEDETVHQEDETTEKTEGNDLDGAKSPGIKSLMTDDDAPNTEDAPQNDTSPANSINRVPSAQQYEDDSAVNAISQEPTEVGENEMDGEVDEELQEVTRQEIQSAISV